MFEIEIKSLLGGQEKALELKRRLVQLFPAMKVLPSHKQRNHYFNTPATLDAVYTSVTPLIGEEKRDDLKKSTEQGSKVSIRTREADGKTLFIIKASIGDDTSANGISRIEFEEPVSLTLDELDKRLLDAGLTYQAKWSRERDEFDLGAVHVTVDKNAGYGYLAEFEKMISDGAQAEQATHELKALMAQLHCVELEQDRLERMFAHYNKHWGEYYGTDKTFTIE
ncbi:MAG: hypothetical protein COV91_05760 [Candidatus Taylorbacteria bacterium CG11_big_fil_rev_8_21_14_0_20_46_11]|uniref:CYTH domain-containing protein n=1 Tax=Candidatus Taylorbacteria bacterium CG11_big_fil_rev_8_21_14_0_20_46_11 TaxID=1975025 RepID=A0A2H0KA22_9BACT|nr:MAG: hypothetical protein COV91_05760 [Candidatus Taylorbacteria bacterium CG11_big_fil_rev_8_21_14_0_20_46_11]